jgi:hypothetical protein
MSTDRASHRSNPFRSIRRVGRIVVLRSEFLLLSEVNEDTCYRRFLPSIANCTVPVGVLAPEGVTLNVAIKITPCPAIDGLAEETTAGRRPRPPG